VATAPGRMLLCLHLIRLSSAVERGCATSQPDRARNHYIGSGNGAIPHCGEAITIVTLLITPVQAG
jgi:hypothetical protein